MKSKKIKIIHIITTLGLGGAEKVLFNILKNNNDKYFEHQVICLSSGGHVTNEIKKLKIKIYFLELNKKFFIGIINCFLILNKFKNKENIIVQTWLPHSDLIGGLISKLCGYKKIIWNIRISNFTKSSFKFRTLIIVLINSLLSYFIPKKIISCSVAGINSHKKFGYNKKIFYLIHNGFDKIKIRNRSLKFSKIFTVGMFSRYHKVKNHEYLFKALAFLKKKNLKFKLLLLGPNINLKNKELVDNLRENNIIKNTIFINKKKIFNVNKYFSYIDLYILCSKTEGFPNILGEAIINGVKVLSTDVGDAKLMLSRKSEIIPKNNIRKFSQKIEEVIKSYDFNKKGYYNTKKYSSIFYKKFSQHKMLSKYQKIWKTI